MFNTKMKSDHNSRSSGDYNTNTNGKSFESINYFNNNNNNWKYQNYDNNNAGKLKSNGKNSSSSGGTGGTILIIIVIIIIAIKLAFLLVDRQRTAANLKEPLMAGTVNSAMAHEYTKYSMEFLTNIKAKTISISYDYGYILWPTFLGIGIALFTWIMMYLDSDIPGIIPQTPFSPRQYGYRYHNERTWHLNYMMSIACGILVFILLYFSNLEK